MLPVATTSSFPSVHRALYAVQGQRLRQPAEVDIASLLQLPQVYWNNWDQWASNGIDSASGQTGTQYNHLGGHNESHMWGTPTFVPGGDAPPDSTVAFHSTDSNTEDAASQTAVNIALLRYMLDGSHA